MNQSEKAGNQALLVAAVTIRKIPLNGELRRLVQRENNQGQQRQSPAGFKLHGRSSSINHFGAGQQVVQRSFVLAESDEQAADAASHPAQNRRPPAQEGQ